VTNRGVPHPDRAAILHSRDGTTRRAAGQLGLGLHQQFPFTTDHRGALSTSNPDRRQLLRRRADRLSPVQAAKLDAALDAVTPCGEVTVAWLIAQQLMAGYARPRPGRQSGGGRAGDGGGEVLPGARGAAASTGP
jgi:hypothetical protein